MARSKKAPSIVATPLPAAPWIYLNDPTDGDVAAQLAGLMPKSGCVGFPSTLDTSSKILATLSDKTYDHSVKVVVDDKTDFEDTAKITAVDVLKTGSIKHGCNFASVNLYRSRPSDKPAKFGTNHLELKITTDDDDDDQCLLDSRDVAENIYKWLFSVLSVRESLHLISDAEMHEVDRSTAYTGYSYCAIADARKQPRDATIQFVALVVSKAIVAPNKRLTWQVADKTGTANFYFTWRGPTSQYTWDWVLALKPGDRKCLPRMPMVRIKEPVAKTIVKAPFRASAAVVTGTGCLFKGVGHGLMQAGRKIKLGSPSEWVPEADTVTDGSGRKAKRTTGVHDVVFKPAQHTAEIKVFTEKGEKTWSDADTLASTTAESMSEKDIKQLV